MGGFQFDLRKGVLVLFVIALPLFSINVQRKPGETPWYFKPFVFVGGVAQTGYSSFSESVRGTVSMYLNLLDVKAENRELKKEVSQLQAKVADLEEIQIENERLEQLLGFKKEAEMDLLTARVIGYDLLFGQYSTIRIGRGSRDGVKVGQAVITPSGVVGSVLSVTTLNSDVLVLTDRYSAIDSVVQRSRARGVTVGALENRTSCYLNYLQRSDDVQNGDLVVTSGLDDIFPKGFPVGRVVKVEKKNYGITQKVEIRPIVNPFHLEEVFVVMRSQPLQVSQREEND